MTDTGLDYSIAIPAYGRPDRLYEAVSAAVAQHFPSELRYEIIVNDDGTTPPLSERLAEFGDKVTIYRNPRNLGWPENWNATLKLAKGRWVHMLHSDDLVQPNFVGEMWRVIQAHPNAVMVHSLTQVVSLGRPLVAQLASAMRGVKNPVDQPDVPFEVYKGGVEAARHALNGVRATTAIVRRDVASSIPMRIDLKNPADEEYFVHLGLLGDIVFYPRRLVVYRYHNDQDWQPSWLKSDFVPKYLRVQQANLELLGEHMTESDRSLAYYRVANAAVNAAHALIMANDLPAAQETLSRAVELAPTIVESSSYRTALLLHSNAPARWFYRSFMQSK